MDTYKAEKNLSHSMHTLPTEVRESDTLLLILALKLCTCPFHGPFFSMFFTFFGLWLVVLLFEMALKP